jgi:hypothetical protein
MARDDKSGDANRNYDKMSRMELLMIIGIDDDPALSRDDLVTMAKDRDRTR